jgi:transposase
VKQDSRVEAWKSEAGLTIGVDLGDIRSDVTVRGADGEIRHKVRVTTTTPKLTQFFAPIQTSLIVMEVGTHSPWVSRLLQSLGHGVIVANPRRLKLISASDSKSDRIDSEMLSELGRCMPSLLNPVQHRSAEAQRDLAVVRVRSQLVRTRSKLWSSLRGMAKSMGERLPRRKIVVSELGPELEVLKPLLESIESLNEKIKGCDEQIHELVQTKYPEAVRLQQVAGVGPIISLTFILTIEHRERFRSSRHVGSYLGLRPKQQDSGKKQPQLAITKSGDRYMRSLLVQGAQYVLGRQSPETDLKRWGLELCARGGKNAKKRAVVAVARKLAVLLHRLWVDGRPYEPVRKKVETVAAV